MVWTIFSLGAPEDYPQAQFRDNSGLNFICRQIITRNVLHLIHYEWKGSQWEKTFESGDFCLLSFLNDIDIDECAYEKGGCQDIRVNTVGSYYCSCSDPEFSLAPEKSHCIGITWATDYIIVSFGLKLALDPIPVIIETFALKMPYGDSEIPNPGQPWDNLNNRSRELL